MFIFALALLFITKLRFPPHRSLYSVILGRYNSEGLKLVRSYEKLEYKLLKCKADVEFLSCCQTNHLTPKFLQFKLYSENVLDKNEYKGYQRRLIKDEISCKETQINRLQNELAVRLEQIRSSFLIQVYSYCELATLCLASLATHLHICIVDGRYKDVCKISDLYVE